MRFTPGRTAAATLVLGLTSATLLAGAAPALAASFDIESSPVVWEGVDDSTSGITDARFSYPGLATMPGWTSDAFDGIARITVFDCSGASGSVTPVFTPTAAPVIAPGGTSTLSLSSTGTVDADSCAPFTITATVTLMGSFARWDYSLTGDADRFEFAASIGSDSDGVYSYPTPSTLLVSDSSQFSPSIALQATSTVPGSWVRATNNIDVAYSVEGSPSTASFVTAVADYTWLTGRAAADAYLASIASTLSTTSFGQSLPLFHGTDSPDFSAQSFAVGVPVNTVVPYAYDEGLFRGLDYFDNTETAHTVQAILGALPTGLTGVVSYAPTTGAPVVSLSGTPTVPGIYAVRVTFYQVEDGDVPAKPLFAELSITVGAVSSAAGGHGLGGAADGQLLAATGVDPAPLAGGAAVILLAGMAVVFVARGRSRVTP